MTLAQLEHDHPGWVWRIRTDRFGHVRYEGDSIGKSVSVYVGWLGCIYVRDSNGAVRTYDDWCRSA